MWPTYRLRQLYDIKNKKKKDRSIHVKLAHPLRAPNGEMLFSQKSKPPRYITSAYSPANMQSESRFDIIALSKALGAYHHIMEAAGGPSEKERKECDDVYTNVENYLKWLESDMQNMVDSIKSEPSKIPDGFTKEDFELLEKHQSHMNFMAYKDNRAQRLAALPYAWVHNDFQYKNILIDSTSDPSAETMTVIDLTDGCYQPRVFDLAYVLSVGGDDEVVPNIGVPGKMEEEEFSRRIEAYLGASGWPFTDEECFLLPSAVQIKLTAASHYWWRYNPNPKQFRKLAQWALDIIEARHMIREAAKKQTEAFVAANVKK